MKYGDQTLDLSGRKVIVARVVSRLTPAPLINFYVGIILSLFSPIGLGPILTPITSIVLCIILMVILPITPILFEAWRGNVDLDVSDRESRTKFFLFSIPFYMLAYVTYSILGCLIMSSLAAAYVTVTIGVAIASLRTKVSVHGAGVGGPGAALLFVYGWIALPVIILWISIIWSRTELKQHTLIQSIIGVLLGIVSASITYPFVYIIQ